MGGRANPGRMGYNGLAMRAPEHGRIRAWRATACEWGLVTAVAEDSAALTALVEEVAAKLNALAPIALRSLKRVLNAAYDTSLKTALELEGQAYEKLRRTEDYAEGLAAFTEKRPPRYTGR